MSYDQADLKRRMEGAIDNLQKESHVSERSLTTMYRASFLDYRGFAFSRKSLSSV